MTEDQQIVQTVQTVQPKAQQPLKRHAYKDRQRAGNGAAANISTYSLSDLKISSTEELSKVSDDRQVCSKCKKSVKLFCYKCVELVGDDSIKPLVPQIGQLPFKLDILKAKYERDGKSTALHAKLIAPGDVDIFIHPDNLPSYLTDADSNEEAERCLLLYPGVGAKPVEEYDPASFDRVIVIDGTWKQANSIVINSPKLLKMRRVTIRPRATLFWRYQQKSAAYMATIEAIYFMYRDYAEAVASRQQQQQQQQQQTESDTAVTAAGYDGRYDNLLFFYKFFYDLIQNLYKSSGKTYTTKHVQGYIKYDDQQQSDGAEHEDA
ncbi:hypothetical protein GQ42DRAFT_161508 [Ramicandelaber brevisporus]|nr:hypothetical protein GQ42DRAFT_161508 [Ramicandelaber brevisporus]